MPENAQTIYYWQDGYWITDKEEAELMDSIDAFGSVHQVLEVPEGDDIQFAVYEQLEKEGVKAIA